MNYECVMYKVYVINNFYLLRNDGLYCVQVYPYTSTKEKYTSTIVVKVCTNVCRLVWKHMENAQYTNDHVAGLKTVITVDVLVLLNTCICYTVLLWSYV